MQNTLSTKSTFANCFGLLGYNCHACAIYQISRVNTSENICAFKVRSQQLTLVAATQTKCDLPMQNL